MGLVLVPSAWSVMPETEVAGHDSRRPFRTGRARRAAGVAPLWSVMIPTYEPTTQLREAIESVRAAAPGGVALQLEVVDDCSPTIDVASLLASWGMASVPVHRRSANGGLGECWNECIRRAPGKTFIHILHQDDLVKPGFYSRMGELAALAPSAGMYFCRTEFLDDRGSRLDALEQPEAGLLVGWLERIAAGQRLQCPSVVVRRETYERVGLFERRAATSSTGKCGCESPRAPTLPTGPSARRLSHSRVGRNAQDQVRRHRHRRHGARPALHPQLAGRCGTARLLCKGASSSR
jgi:hypothetical protein